MTMPTPELAASAATLSPLALFLQADIIVKGVMAGLLAASVWTWAVIIGFGRSLGGLVSGCATYEKDFWNTDSTDRFIDKRGRENLPSARVLMAGVAEWRRSTQQGKVVDREGARDRLSTMLAGAVAKEVDDLSDRLNILATIGSVAPFVGLFGTVWGIMRSFTSIAAQQNSSLAVVAPGIAEALFATAIGLFAAIPAVIAYNRFSHRINRLEANLHRFSDSIYTTLSRELEVG